MVRQEETLLRPRTFGGLVAEGMKKQFPAINDNLASKALLFGDEVQEAVEGHLLDRLWSGSTSSWRPT